MAPIQRRIDRKWPQPGRPGGRGPVKRKPRPDDSWEQQTRCELTCRADVVEGDRSYFRPGEMLLDGAAAERLRPHLERLKGEPDRDFQERAAALGSTVVLWRLPREIDLVDLVTWLRRRASRQDDEPVGVGVNAVWRGAPRYQGGPGGPPTPAKPLDLSSEGKSAWDPDRDADVATLDTGWAAGLPAALQAQLVPDIDDEEEVDANSDGQLDTQNGHGSFVAGVVHQFSPDLVIDPGKVLDTTGIGDDASITLELLETKAPVINLSLGGYTEDDRPPVGMADAVRILRRRSVLVAAAGNNSSGRPFWPAAFKGVLAVAAYDSREGRTRRARFSNFGHWVDLCAPGVDVVSTFVHFPGQPTFDGWAKWSGTSFASPFVAAVIAHLVRNGVPRLEAVARVLEACVDVPALSVYGPVLTPEAAGKLA